MNYEDFKKKTLLNKQEAHEMAITIDGRMSMQKIDWWTALDYHRVMLIPENEDGKQKVFKILLLLMRFGMLKQKNINDVPYFQVELFSFNQERNMRNNLQATVAEINALQEQIRVIVNQIKGLQELRLAISIVLPKQK